MAASPEQKRRDQAVRRELLRRYRADDEERYRRLRDEIRADIDKEQNQGVER